MDSQRTSRVDALFVGPLSTAVQDLKEHLELDGVRLCVVGDTPQACEVALSYPFAVAIVDTRWTEAATGTLLQALHDAGIGCEQVLALVSEDDNEDLIEHLFAQGVGDVVVGHTTPEHLAHTIGLIRDHLQAYAPHDTHVATPTTPSYCAHCLSLVSPQFPRCISCGAQRPESGWPLAVAAPLQRLGRRVDRYTLTQLIGNGATASVYGARDAVTGEQVAIKLLDAPHLDSTMKQEQGRREAEILARIPSPHVVSAREVVNAEGTVGIVMDIAEGLNLRQHVRMHGPLEPTLALKLMIQVAEALHAAHEHGVVHRDLKPANIHIALRPGDEVHASVVDFGIARLLDLHPANRRFHGTPAYASPEQIEAPETVDGRSDIYAMAGVLYFALTGHRPFAGDHASEQLWHQLHSPFPTLGTRDVPVCSPVVDGLNRLLAGMSAKSMTDRFHSMSQLGAAMHALLNLMTYARHDAELKRTLLIEGTLDLVEARTAAHAELRRLALQKDALVERYELALAAYNSAPQGSRHRREARERLKDAKRRAAELRQSIQSLQAVTRMVTSNSRADQTPLPLT